MNEEPLFKEHDFLFDDGKSSITLIEESFSLLENLPSLGSKVDTISVMACPVFINCMYFLRKTNTGSVSSEQVDLYFYDPTKASPQWVK